MKQHIKQVVVAVAVTMCAVLALSAMGGYSLVFAKSRRVPIYKVAGITQKVAISFDAAWGADKTEKIMDICDEYGVKATFFLVGFWVDKYPEMVTKIEQRGFEIGTHSNTHPKMSQLDEEKVMQELTQSIGKIQALTNSTVTLFRPPFGDYNNTLIECAEKLGLHTIQWSVDSLDWKGLTGKQIAERVQKMQAGDIVLCHNNSDHILDALPLIFESAKNKGLTFCPVGQLIYTDGYTVDANGVQHLSVQIQQ